MTIKDFNPLEEQPYQVMDLEGNVIRKGWKQSIPDDELTAALRNMLFVRQLDAMAISYQRQGRMYTYPPHLGQEAPAIAAGTILREDDWLVPSPRDIGALYLKGVSVKELFLYYRGHEISQHYENARRVLPITIPIANQIPHAAGVGYGIKLRGEDSVVLVFSGDGGTSEGDFHEGLNFASVWKAPLVTVIQNNQYAISVPVHKQSGSRTLAAKAVAYGMPGIRVDGNDYLAVHDVLTQAVGYSRQGNGPIMVEALTYRRGAHTTSDDPKLYRSSKEESEWEPKDPVNRLRAYLDKKGLWSREEEEKLIDRFKKEIDIQFREAEKVPPHSLEDVFKYTFSELPPELERQKQRAGEYMAAKEHRK